MLLDFGAVHDYSEEFIELYMQVIHGSAIRDHQKVLEYSK